MRNYTSSKGFSLVELMVVVAIIGVLAAIAIPSYQRYTLKAKVAGVVSAGKGYMDLIEEYISSDTRCFGRNSDGSTGSQYGVNTTEFNNNPTTAATNLVWRGDTGPLTGFTPGSCVVVVRGNPAVFNANFQLWYFTPPLANLSGDGATVRWTCYFELFDSPANNAKMLPAMPANCANRAGNF